MLLLCNPYDIWRILLWASIEQNKKKEPLENFLKEFRIKRPLQCQANVNKDDYSQTLIQRLGIANLEYTIPLPALSSRCV